MKKVNVLFVILFLTGVHFGVVAQSGNEVLEALVEKTIKGTDNRAKIYVYTDKPAYRTGTSIFLKVFLLQESSNLMYTQPETVYLELVDGNNNGKEKIVFEANDKEREGTLAIPATIETGLYYLRAYTEYMANRHPSDIFLKPIFISNGKTNIPNTPVCVGFNPLKQNLSGTRFYPEGNYLINSVENRIVVQSFATNGFPQMASGIIKDTRDSIVARFQTNKDGLGSFNFVPYKGRKYKCFITIEGKMEEQLLPEAPAIAYQLVLQKEDKTALHFRIGLSDQLYSESPNSYLIAVSNGKVCFAANGKGMYLVQVPKEKFTTGLADFYLFNGKQELVSRRSVYIEQKTKPVQINADKKQYMSRATVNLEIAVLDSPLNIIPALLSVSVTDDRYIVEDPFPSMADYFLSRKLLLPPSKFRLTPSNIDLASVVYGSELSLPVQASDNEGDQSKGFHLAGSLENNKGPIAKQAISIMSDQQKSILLFDTTDDKGSFSVGPVLFYDSTRFLLHPEGKSISVKDWKVQVQSVIGPGIENLPLQGSCYLDSSFEKLITLFEKSFPDTVLTGSLQKWIVTGPEKKIPIEPTQASIKRNKFSKYITREQLSKLELSTTANAVLMIPGVRNINGRIVLRGGTPALDASLDQNIEPLVVVDGVQAPVGSGGVAAYLNSIPPDLIEYIEVLIGGEAAAFATRGINGVIIIKTGLPNDRSKPSDNVLGFYPKGFHVPSTLPSPNYSDEKIREGDFVDNRSTIFWTTNILTDEKGKIKLRFFTGDRKSTYTVTVVGINARGEFIYQKGKIQKD